MSDTSIKKVSSHFSPQGEMGQRYLTAVEATHPPAHAHDRDES